MFLRIRNRGVADYRLYCLLGASTSRDNNLAGTIGQFGSGAKLAIAKLLRDGQRITICPGNLTMEFFSQVVSMDSGHDFNRIYVKYSGTLPNGKTKNDIEERDTCLEWGVQDWTDLAMALRELIANAIDASIEQGGSYKDVEIDVVDKIRAKRDCTAVYIPYTPEVQSAYEKARQMFLHFTHPHLLNQKILPNINADKPVTRIYKKGVLVSKVNMASIYDYNLGDELRLDESRNADEWSVRHVVASLFRNASAGELFPILESVVKEKENWENTFQYYDVETEAGEEGFEVRSREFQKAWSFLAGDKGCLTNNRNLDTLVEGKGYVPVVVTSPSWYRILSKYNVLTDTKVLTENEMDGKVLLPASDEMVTMTQKVWSLLEAYNLCNGKGLPQVKGFKCIMDGKSQTLGYYIPGEDVVYLHESLSGKLLFKVALEEVAHYVTGCSDNSRGFQDFLFNLVTDMVYVSHSTLGGESERRVK